MPKTLNLKRIRTAATFVIVLTLIGLGALYLKSKFFVGAYNYGITGMSFYLKYPSSEKNNIQLKIEMISGTKVMGTYSGSFPSLAKMALETIYNNRGYAPITKLFVEDDSGITDRIKVTITSAHYFNTNYKIPDGLSAGNRGNYFPGTDQNKKEFFLQYNKPMPTNPYFRQINLGELSVEAIPSQPASIQGTVKINGTDHHLLNAQLFLLQNDQKIADTASSGLNGSYSFNDLKSGSNFEVGGYDIDCGGAASSNPIYMDYSFTISRVSQINLNPGSNTIDLVANKTLCRGAVSGKFIDSQYNPVDNVRVEAYSSSSGSSRSIVAQTGKTDYIFNDLTPGAWMISATRNGVNGDDYRDNDSDKSYNINITDSNTFFEFKDFKFNNPSQ